MSYSRAINEIAGLLTQAGTPANHANDIASRLAFALSDYYDYRIASAGSKDVTNGSDQTSSFKRAFAPPEATRPGTPGANGTVGTVGADGRWAWAAGKDGKDGQDSDGSSDNYNTFYDYGTTVVGGGGGLNISNVNCMDLKAKLQSCGIETGGDCDCSQSLVCGPGSGIVRGQNICNVLDDHAKQLRKIRERLDAIEKQLKDAVDC
jgi:hypothetical protein